jgi:hypothetical protein
MPKMRVLVDGKEIPVQNDVRVIHEDDPANNDMHLVLNHEGMVIDIVEEQKKGESKVVATGWFTLDDLGGFTTGPDDDETDEEDE